MFPRVLLLAVVAWALGCETTDHENIDKWSHTGKGPAKLRKALADGTIEGDLSAHAAANLLKRGDDRDVYAAFETMAPARRSEVIARLAPRVWEIARVENEQDLPGAPQVIAKDALVRLRTWADDATRKQLDAYLIDFYCVSSYEGRAKVGANLGATVIRRLGPLAARKLISVVDGVIAAPGQDRTKNRIGDELLIALAATASPDAVSYVLDIARMDRGDPTLPRRAMAALYKAYVDPAGLFEVADPQALIPNLSALVEIARDDAQDSQVANDAVSLTRAAGAPACLAPLLGMIGAPHRDARFKFVAANHALRCGGPAAILDVVRALPDAGGYGKDRVTTAISDEIARMSPRDQVQAAARALLADKSTIATWIAMETLAAMKATDDAPRVAALASRRERLIGYWGEQAERKKDPTLGQRAKQLAAVLSAK
jgi:hypothetical protein